MNAIQPADNTLRVMLNFNPAVDMTDDQFFNFCQINRELRIEKTEQGKVLIMSPTGGETSWRNSELIISLGNWAKQDNKGVVFDSSGGFVLPNGAIRSPDAAWMRRSRLTGLTSEQKKKFIPLCPDFVIELRSPSDSLTDLQEKMQEYINNGTQLGWLIDPTHKTIHIYTPDKAAECLENPENILGDPVLQGFVLNLHDIWKSGF
ncbi:MAG: Uma2 family endonuclease [Desulfobacteraceae bacterium]|nr:Uma2 family endonuclease [Desulfobacteraceae bacterium]